MLLMMISFPPGSHASFQAFQRRCGRFQGEARRQGGLQACPVRQVVIRHYTATICSMVKHMIKYEFNIQITLYMVYTYIYMNGDFERKLAYKWSIFQHTMFDYRKETLGLLMMDTLWI